MALGSVFALLPKLEITGANGFEPQVEELYNKHGDNLYLFKKQLQQMFNGAQVTVSQNASTISVKIAEPNVIDTIKFVNFPNLSNSKLDKITSQFVLIGDATDNYKTWQAAQAMQNVMRNSGYSNARVVRSNKFNHSTGYTTIVFRCIPGAQTKIANIAYKYKRPVIGQLQLPSTSIIPFFRPVFTYHSLALNEQQIVSQLHELGYLDARVTSQFKVNNNRAYVIYTIAPGVRYTLHKIKWIGYWGNTNKQQINQFVKKQPLTRALYLTITNRIERIIESKPFSCYHELELDRIQHTGAIILHANHIQPVVVKDVEFAGNHRSYQDSLLQKAGVYPGDLMTPLTLRSINKRASALKEAGIALHGELVQDTLKIAIKDASIGEHELGLSAAASYNREDGFDAGFGVHYKDANFLDIGPLLCDLSLKNTGQILHIYNKQFNLFGLNTATFIDFKMHKINQHRLFDYMQGNLFQYMRHTTAIIDAKAGIILPITSNVSVQTYINPSISRYGINDIPDAQFGAPLFSTKIFPSANQLSVTFGNNIVFQETLPSSSHLLSCDLSTTIFSGSPFITCICKYNGTYMTNIHPITIDASAGHVFNNKYWVNNLTDFHCKLLGAHPLTGFYRIGGKTGYKITCSTPIITKDKWNLQYFIESGCIWNSGLDTLIYRVCNDNVSANIATGISLNLTLPMLPPVGIFIGVPVGVPCGHELIGGIRWNIELGSLLI